MKIVMISDTHDRHLALNGFMPEGDVLIHAGDLTMEGSINKAQRALDWLNDQPYKYVVAIAGNHDFCFEHEHKKEALEFGKIIYLENTSAIIEGVNFWGSPVQPRFFNWAFNVDRGDAIARYWNMIPYSTDVLITHGPPLGILDKVPRYGERVSVGCYNLKRAVERIKPKLHVFGHIHDGYGSKEENSTRFVNASVCTEMYRPENLPITFELEN